MLVYMGGRINSSGDRGMAVETKANICCRGFWCCVDMERPDGAVDEKSLHLKVHGDNQSLPGDFGS